MKENNFEKNNAWQRKVRDSILIPAFYPQYANDGHFCPADGGRQMARTVQALGADTFVKDLNGHMLAVEEKIVEWPGYAYTAYFLETMSCTVPGYERDGWMAYGGADILLYCMVWPDRLVLDEMALAPLRDLYWREAHRFPVSTMKDRNRSRGSVVPIKFLRANGIKINRYHLYPDPSSEYFAELFPSQVGKEPERRQATVIMPAGSLFAEDGAMAEVR